MTAAELLVDGFDRIRDGVKAVVDGLSADELAFRLDGQGNPVGWLVWHLTRVQDDHIADAAGSAQGWIADGWPTSAQTPTWVASANTVNNDFVAAGQQSLSVLRVTATLSPSTSPKETPVLQDWRASYDCVPSQ